MYTKTYYRHESVLVPKTEKQCCSHGLGRWEEPKPGSFRANLHLQEKWADKLAPKMIKKKDDSSGTQIADTAPERTARDKIGVRYSSALEETLSREEREESTI